MTSRNFEKCRTHPRQCQVFFISKALELLLQNPRSLPTKTMTSCMDYPPLLLLHDLWAIQIIRGGEGSAFCHTYFFYFLKHFLRVLEIKSFV